MEDKLDDLRVYTKQDMNLNYWEGFMSGALAAVIFLIWVTFIMYALISIYHGKGWR